MDLDMDLAQPQVISTFDDPWDPVRIATDAVTDPTETDIPVVWMVITEYSGVAMSDLVTAEIQLRFTRDQMREHIVRCQKAMGLLP
jgi:hypothetical protein